MTVKEMQPGQVCVVSAVSEGNQALRRRIFDMGITPGVSIRMIKVAPLGDPVEVMLRGYDLSLRKSEAELVQVNRD